MSGGKNGFLTNTKTALARPVPSLFGGRPLISIYGQRMRLEPQFPRLDHRIHSHLQPPNGFVAAAMNIAMVPTAQWHREFVAHLAAERWALCEAHVVGVRWSPATDQARLLGNEPDVIAVADPPWLGESKHALVNSFGAPLPSAAEVNARRPWLQAQRSCCPVSQFRRRCWLSVICGERRQSRSKRVLDALGVCRQQSILFAQAAVCPCRGIITRAEFIEFRDESIAQLRGRFSVQRRRCRDRMDLIAARNGGWSMVRWPAI
jgi:hypothetical protein